jgi:hypothetical protein
MDGTDRSKTATIVFLGLPYVGDDLGILTVCNILKIKDRCRRFLAGLRFWGRLSCTAMSCVGGDRCIQAVC